MMVVWTILYPIIETSITANGMAAFGWNFVMAFYRACFLMQSGVQNATLPGYNLASAIVWLYIDTVLYLVLAWYFTTYRRKPSTAFTPTLTLNLQVHRQSLSRRIRREVSPDISLHEELLVSTTC